MKTFLFSLAFIFALSDIAIAYDSQTLVDTNNSSSSTSTVNSSNVNTNTSTSTSTSSIDSTSANTNTNTNYNVNSGTTTVNNVNTGTMTYNNNNVNTNTSTSTSASTSNNVNTNSNTSASTSTNTNQNVNTGDMTNRNISSTEITQKVIQPPPTAVAPSMMSGGNSDLCTTGTSGSIQTQIFGVASGGTVRDLNCERLKLSKTLFDMGMKVAAVATMCQDKRVFDAMIAAGTPCPYEGKIGDQAKIAWDSNKNKIPKEEEPKDDDTYKKVGFGTVLGIAVFKLFGL